MKWSDVPNDVLLKAAMSVDGWTIWDPQKFVDMGVPAELIATVARDHKSDGSYKGSIWDKNGNMFASCAGVYGLDLLRAIAADLKVDYPDNFSGRGFQAQAIQQALKESLKNA